MAKDHRYQVVKRLIEANDIKAFQDIFNFIPKRVIYGDLGVNYAKFQRLFASPDLLTLRELLTLAALIECEPHKLFDLATAHKVAKKGTKKK